MGNFNKPTYQPSKYEWLYLNFVDLISYRPFPIALF